MWRVRAILFNNLFYSMSFLILTACLPMVVLPRSWQRRVPPVWLAVGYFLEKHILGLDYEVIGQENLPPPPYLVAMKHESAWETMKLYRLFGDPAIVLKKELMGTPILGNYAHIMDMVPVDRARGREATKYMVEASRKILTDKRPLVIFPQGTRVRPDVKQTYKIGIMKLYEDLHIPLVPVALNSGIFWGRNAFWKRPGKISIYILPPFAPHLSSGEVFPALTNQIETESARLAREAVQQYGLRAEWPLLAENA